MQTKTINLVDFKEILQKDKDLKEVYNHNPYKYRVKLIKNSSELIKSIFSQDSSMSKHHNIGMTRKNGSDFLEKINNLQTVLEKKEYRAIGLHFIDEVIGRYSDIAISCSNPIFEKQLKQYNLSIKYSQKYAEIYSKIWLNIYKKVLKTRTSLVNAFYDGSLKWEDETESLQLNWEKRVENQNYNQFGESVNLRFDFDFVEQSISIAKEFSFAIFSTMKQNEGMLTDIANIPQIDKTANQLIIENSILQDLTDKILSVLNKSAIEERIHETLIMARIKILKKSKIRDAFFEVLNFLVFYDAKKLSELDEIKNAVISNKDSVRSTEYWETINVYLEAIQSAIFNHESFCDDKGFILHKYNALGLEYLGSEKKINLYLIEVCKDIDTTINSEIKTIIGNVFRAIPNVPEKKKADSKGRSNSKKDTPKFDIGTISDEIINNSNWKETETKSLSRWIEIVYHIANNAIHESTQLKFLIGIGPGFYKDVMFKEYELAPENLLSRDSNIYRIVHFIKSYYSLFEIDKKKIIWFDEYCNFLGIFEFEGAISSISSSKSHNVILANIHGKDKFDILIQENKPIIRIISGKPKITTDETVVGSAIEYALSKIMKENNEDFSIHLQFFINQLVEEAKLKALGTSFVIVNEHPDLNPSHPYSNDTWRNKLNYQSKSLTEQLKRYNNSVIRIDDFKKIQTKDYNNRLNVLIDDILSLAQLDGAILIKIKKDGIHITPNQLLIPLINKESNSEIITEHFDYYRLRISVKEKLDKKSTDTLNNKFKTCESSDYLELCKFISDIGNDNKSSEYRDLKKLDFLNSAGTRHHSLWGITLSAKDTLFVVTISEDGDIRIFWNGFILNGQ